MRLTSKGQVTIPGRLRESTGLLPHTEVVFEQVGGAVLVRPAAGARPEAFRKALVRARGSADAVRDTAELMRLTRE